MSFFPEVVVVLMSSSSLSVVARIRAQRSAPSGWWRSRRTRRSFLRASWMAFFLVFPSCTGDNQWQDLGKADKSAQEATRFERPA